MTKPLLNTPLNSSTASHLAPLVPQPAAARSGNGVSAGVAAEHEPTDFPDDDPPVIDPDAKA